MFKVDSAGIRKQLKWSRHTHTHTHAHAHAHTKPTWSHKNMYLCALSVWHRFTYFTARFAAVSKRNVLWVALKHRLNTWTLARFYYVDIGTYCCVFIALFQVRTAAVQNSNIRGLSLKVNALSCWKYALHQTQP